MIVGSMRNWESERQYVNPILCKAIDYLSTTDFNELEDGKYPIWGEDMFALLMSKMTMPKAEQPAEKHERLFDIHYLLHGEETIGWKSQDGNCKPSQAYNQEDDFALYTELENETMIKLTSGMYMVLFPEDIHRPCVAEGLASEVRKVVVKVNRALF